MKFSRKYMYAAAAPLTIGGLLATTAALPASAAARPRAPAHRVRVDGAERTAPV